MAESVSCKSPLQKIQMQYLQMVPLKKFHWEGINQLEPNLQRTILQMTYYFSTGNAKCSPSVSYKRSFLKCFLKLCEDNGCEVIDEPYQALGEALAMIEDRNEICYKTYILPCGTMITTGESQQLISRGTTGLYSWPGALYLAEWALENSSVFRDRSILELGCGVGLTGLVICSTCSPKQYIFTDCHDDVCQVLQQNLELNGFIPREHSVSHDKKGYKESSLMANGKASSLSSNMEDSRPDEHRVLSVQSHQSNVKGEHNTKETSSHFSKGPAITELQAPESTCNLNKRDTSEKGPVQNGTHSPKPLIKKNESHLVTWFSRSSQTSCSNLDSCGVLQHCKGEHTGIYRIDDWRTVRKSDLEDLCPELIVAADVVYDVDLIPSLVEVLHILLRSRGNMNKKPVAYIASTVRNPETYQCFVNILDKFKICWTELTGPTHEVFYYDRSCPIKLIKLQV